MRDNSLILARFNHQNNSRGRCFGPAIYPNSRNEPRSLGPFCPCYPSPVLGETQLPPATETSQWPLSPEGAYLGMRAYEVMVILDPDLEEKTVKPSLDTFLNVVKKDGGTVDGVDVWGRRRMAYDIAKKSEGIYAVMDLICSAAAVAELDRQLNLNEAVLRTKVIRREDKEK